MLFLCATLLSRQLNTTHVFCLVWVGGTRQRAHKNDEIKGSRVEIFVRKYDPPLDLIKKRPNSLHQFAWEGSGSFIHAVPICHFAGCERVAQATRVRARRKPCDMSPNEHGASRASKQSIK